MDINVVLQDFVTFLMLALFVAAAVYLIARRMQLTASLRLERTASFNKLLDKFSTAEEFVAFAQTEQGKKLLENPVPPARHPKMWVIRLLQIGVVLTAVGVGLFVYWLRLAVHGAAAPGFEELRDESAAFFGFVLILALGLGALAAGAVTNALANRWRLGEPLEKSRS